MTREWRDRPLIKRSDDFWSICVQRVLNHCIPCAKRPNITHTHTSSLDTQPVAVSDPHAPHDLGQGEALKLPQPQQLLDSGQEQRSVPIGPPQLLRDHIEQALPYKQEDPVRQAVGCQERGHISARLPVSGHGTLLAQEVCIGALPVVAQQAAEEGRHVEEAAGESSGPGLLPVQVGLALQEDQTHQVRPLEAPGALAPTRW